MNKYFKYIDKPLFFSTVLLCLIGLVMVFSASSVACVLQYKTSTYYFFTKQLIFMLTGFIFGTLLLLRIPIKKYHNLRVPIILAVILLLGGLFFYGKITNNALSWYNVGPISIQPSEFAKTGIILYLATFFGKNINSKKVLYFIRPIIISGIIALFVFIQPDLGTAAIIGCAVFMIFMGVPFDKKNKLIKIFKILGITGIICLVSIMIFGGELLNNMQMNRLTFRNPCSRYTKATGYQVCNGLIAINNGGLLGVGLGNSTQKYMYLPEAHTDFIFPIIVEELGSIVSSAIIILYLFILFRLLRIAKTSKDLTGSLIAYGTFSVMILHIFINLGGVLALIPLTGVPLPLLSYGGSITLNTLFMIFLSLRVSIENNITKEKLLLNIQS